VASGGLEPRRQGLMRLHLCAVGRLRAGPERDLIDDYLQRLDRTGRALGLGPVAEHEVEDKKGGGMTAEGALLSRAIPEGAALCVLDERGRTLSSPEFAQSLSQWRDTGRQDAAFVIGGADGVDPALRARADLVISFGRMVWPHMLVRVMLAEQLYRAATILAGSPYHRV
jgi:23S rRNA (pseudouridine1915-N3)-methyltransferase